MAGNAVVLVLTRPEKLMALFYVVVLMSSLLMSSLLFLMSKWRAGGREILNDEYFMRRALEIAKTAAGRTHPNPAVGAVVVKDGRAAGIGAHLKAGGPHAEIHALRMAGPEAQGATMYVTLEPCAHHGRTPPCADAVVAAGIRRVVVASVDPNPMVSGRGIDRLRSAGIEVSVGCLEEEARGLNEVYFHYVRTGTPFVSLKLAVSLDGRIHGPGEDRRVTGPESIVRSHALRDLADVVLVGVGTVLADDPKLTVRLGGGGKQPVRAVLDTRLRTPPHSDIVTDRSAETWIFCGPDAPQDAAKRLQSAGVRVKPAALRDGRLDIRAVLGEFARAGLTHVLVEGGAEVAAAFLRQRAVQRVYCFHAPTLFGGGVPALREGALPEPIRLREVAHEWLGEDVLTVGAPDYPGEDFPEK